MLDDFCATPSDLPTSILLGLSPSPSPDPATEPRTRQARARVPSEADSPSRGGRWRRWRRAPTLSGEFQFPGDVWDSEREGMRVLLFSADQELERAIELRDVLFSELILIRSLQNTSSAYIR